MNKLRLRQAPCMAPHAVNWLMSVHSADLVVLAQDPSADINVIDDSKSRLAVMRQGIWVCQDSSKGMFK